MSRPLILFDPHPRTEAMVYPPDCAAALAGLGRVVAHFGSPMPDDQVEALLPETALIIGQTAMGRARLDRAPLLKGILNVKANWEPNIDYAAAQARGIHVLSAAPAMAPAVAEFCLAQAISLARGLAWAHARFQAGQEAYGSAGNETAFSLYGARIGFVGYGNLGRALAPLLRPFGARISVYDPWLSPGYLRAEGLIPADLGPLLAGSQFLFLLAGATEENQGFLDRAAIETIRPDAAVILASRAEIVDFEALLARAQSGALRLAVDVYPQEPVAPDAPFRQNGNSLFTAHLAGGLQASYARLREAMLEDAAQILAGRPPLRMQPAIPRLAAISNSR